MVIKRGNVVPIWNWTRIKYLILDSNDITIFFFCRVSTKGNNSSKRFSILNDTLNKVTGNLDFNITLNFIFRLYNLRYNKKTYDLIIPGVAV